MEEEEEVFGTNDSVVSTIAAVDPGSQDYKNLIIHALRIVCNASDYEPEPGGTHCPKVFDGWSCWNETPSGSTAYASCPHFQTGFDPHRQAHKKCLEDGTWFRHPQTNMTWSNYTTCVDLEALQSFQAVNTVFEVGYLISTCALLISLIIFCSFRCLQCTRVRIHKHLFVSFIINNFLWLIWYRTVANSSTPANQQNQAWCTSLHILVHYFMVANYFWMFCEGFYLHTLLVYSFTRAESKLLKGFYVFGWLAPAIPISLYASFRAIDPDPGEQRACWIEESRWSYFLTVPVCLCLLLSLAFLINILRVLLTKLNANRRSHSVASNRRASTVAENTASLKKAARATCILIPLLGLHYFVTPFRPDASSKWFIFYEYLAAITSSLQGFAVSLLFCFCNGEVLSVLKRKFFPRKWNTRNNEYSCAPTTMTTILSKRKQNEPGRNRLSPHTDDDDRHCTELMQQTTHFGKNYIQTTTPPQVFDSNATCEQFL